MSHLLSKERCLVRLASEPGQMTADTAWGLCTQRGAVCLREDGGSDARGSTHGPGGRHTQWNDSHGKTHTV